MRRLILATAALVCLGAAPNLQNTLNLGGSSGPGATTVLDVNPSDVTIPTPTIRMQVQPDGGTVCTGSGCWTQQGDGGLSVVSVTQPDGGTYAWPAGSWAAGATKALKFTPALANVMTFEDPGLPPGDFSYLVAAIGGDDSNAGQYVSRDRAGYGIYGFYLMSFGSNQLWPTIYSTGGAGYTQPVTATEAFGPKGTPHILVFSYHYGGPTSSSITLTIDGVVAAESLAAVGPVGSPGRCPLRLCNKAGEPNDDTWSGPWGSTFCDWSFSDFTYWDGWAPNSMTAPLLTSGVAGTTTTGTYAVKLTDVTKIALATVLRPTSTWTDGGYFRVLGPYIAGNNTLYLKTDSNRAFTCSINNAAGAWQVALTTAPLPAGWDSDAQSHELGCEVSGTAMQLYLDRVPVATTMAYSGSPLTLTTMPGADQVGRSGNGSNNWAGTITRAAECAKFVKGTCPAKPSTPSTCAHAMSPLANPWVLWYGNSIMVGDWTGQGYTVSTTTLQTALGAANQPWSIKNAGIAGEVGASGAERWRDVYAGRRYGYTVSMDESINDCHFHQDTLTPAQIVAMTEAHWADVAKESTLIAMTSSASCVAGPMTDGGYTEAQCERIVRDTLIRDSASHPEWHLVDVYPYSENMASPGCCSSGWCYADGTHPNQHGNDVLAALAYAKIKALEGVPMDGGMAAPPPVPQCLPPDGGAGWLSADGGCQ